MESPEKPRLLLLGIGQVSRAIIAQARGTRAVHGTTRNPLRIFELVELGITPLIMPLPSAQLVEHEAIAADVVVTFPPDGETDAILARGVQGARRVVYISSTSVYGQKEGIVDDTTPTDPACPRSAVRLHAEQIWRDRGAIVLRAPGIYGKEQGLHLALRDGKYQMPGMGERVISRIHVDDLAGLVLAVLDSDLTSETFVVGDKNPCPQKEIVSWLCEKMQMPMPPCAALNEVNPTLRGNRRINAERILARLNYKLKYPDFQSGYGELLASVSAKADS